MTSSNNIDLHRKYEPEDITTQELAELLPLLIDQWRVSSMNGFVSTNFIKNLEKNKPTLIRHFKRGIYDQSTDSLTD